MDGVSNLQRALRLGLLIVLVVAGLYAGNATTRSADAAAGVTSSYWIANAKGAVWNFGGAAAYGDLSSLNLNKPIVGIAPTVTAKGYWLVATDGGIFSFGDAKFLGSTGGIKLNKPIVGMAPTPTGKGYWMVATDGGIFSFGDAAFYGSTGSLRLNKPIVAMQTTPTGKGYWLIASDGGIFTFGDAKFYGSTGGIVLNKPITAMTATPSGKGYWLVASDGGIFTFGDAKFYGSAGGTGTDNYARVIATADSQGYWLVRNGGDALGFGTAAGSNGLSGGTGTQRTIPPFGVLYNVSGPGDLAVLWAMGERGKPYIWGGNGPTGYDCSGLTLGAWRQGGVALPRVANDQYDIGRKVNLDAMVPGDLLFWATDKNDSRSIYHVALYVGGGNVVMAPKTADVVRIAPFWTTDLMPFAVRPRG